MHQLTGFDVRKQTSIVANGSLTSCAKYAFPVPTQSLHPQASLISSPSESFWLFINSMVAIELYMNGIRGIPVLTTHVYIV